MCDSHGMYANELEILDCQRLGAITSWACGTLKNTAWPRKRGHGAPVDRG